MFAKASQTIKPLKYPYLPHNRQRYKKIKYCIFEWCIKFVAREFKVLALSNLCLVSFKCNFIFFINFIGIEFFRYFWSFVKIFYSSISILIYNLIHCQKRWECTMIWVLFLDWLYFCISSYDDTEYVQKYCPTYNPVYLL